MRDQKDSIYKILRLASSVDPALFGALLIIRHVSPGFIPTYRQLTLEDMQDSRIPENDCDCTPWQIVADAPKGKVISSAIAALSAIRSHSPLFDCLTEKLKYATPTETNELIDLIHILSHISTGNHALAEIYEVFLSSWFPSDTQLHAAKSSGDIYTPRDVSTLIWELLDLNGKTFYDPCCGSGSLLARAFLSLPLKKEVRLFGQTNDLLSYCICQTYFFLLDIPVDLAGMSGNTLVKDLHAKKQFDRIATNPPFNQARWYDSGYIYDRRWQYGIPPRSNANFAWLQHVISHLSDQGRAAVILSNGSLSTQNHAEHEIRRRILDDGLIEAIIALPPKLFFNTKVPCCIWLLRKPKVPGAPILMIDARYAGFSDKNGISPKTGPKLVDTVLRHRSGALEGKCSWYAVVSPNDIAREHYILSPNLYTKPVSISPASLIIHRPVFLKLIDKLSTFPECRPILPCIQLWRHAKYSSHWKNFLWTDLYQVSGGLAKKREFFGHGVPMADVKTVIRHTFLPDALSSSVELSEAEFEKYRIKAGDILINRTSETIAELACCCIAAHDYNAVYGGYLKRLRPLPDSPVSPFYMAAYLNSHIYRLEVENNIPACTTRANISTERLSRIHIYYPESDMQKILGDTIFSVRQFQKECQDSRLSDLLNRFIRLLIEQFITYPILQTQQKEE